MVNPSGPLDAKICIIGEAPGEDEVRSGQPFTGASGKLLTQMLSAAGIERSQCYLTNVVKVHPPNNDFGVFYVDKKRSQPSDILRQSTNDLHAEIARIKPNVIVLAGAEALRAVTGRRNITSWRGSILSSPLGKCIPILHPAHTLRMYKSRPITELDLRRVLEESLSPCIDIPQQRFILDPTFEQVIGYLNSPHKRLAFDIETTSCGDARILTRCLGLSGDLHHAICIPFIKSVQTLGLDYGGKVLIAGSKNGSEVGSAWTPSEEYEIVKHLDRIFRDESIEKVAQNMGFDVPILAREFGFSFNNLIQDTMLAHHTCYCELPKALDFLCSIYTRTPYYSDYDAADDKQTWQYNCYDASVTLEISQHLDREMVEMGVADYYYSIKHPAALALLRAETRGILIDVKERERRTTLARTARDELEIKIRQHIRLPDFNCRSDKQIKDYLYGTLKLFPEYKIDPKTKERRQTSDKHAREKLKHKYPQHAGILELLSDHSVVDTLLTNFLEKPLGSDERIRTHYNAAGTDTDRLASSEPLFDIGTNLQNIPKGDFRRMFVADKGWLLIKADLSQAEFRYVVWDAKIHRLIERYRDDLNFDAHLWMASLIFKKPENEITKPQRDISKNANYGGNYDMKPQKASQVYHLPLSDTIFVFDERKRQLPELANWHKSIQARLSRSRLTMNPLGRKRLWFDRLDDDMYRIAYADGPQSSVGGIINRAFWLADACFDERECFPLLQVHDEIVFMVREELASSYTGKVRKLMQYPLFFEGVETPLIIPADVSIGKNWYDQEKVSQ